MIKERIIETGADGSNFAVNAVTMIYEDMDGHNLTFFISPEGLYTEVHKGVVRMSQTDAGDTSKLAPEQRLLKEQLVKVIKAGVKGIFMMYGDKLMTLFYGSSTHPRPPKDKKLDLVNWYLEELTKILIAHMMKNDIVLKGQRTEVNGVIISVDAVSTRPVPAVEKGTGNNGHQPGTD
jgi:hypothetical protein